MKILLLGSGGRECALAWKISQSPLTEKLYIAPGNGGTGAYGENTALSPLDFEAVGRFVDEKGIDMLVVGNEDPLVAGITDFFAESRPQLRVVGPTKSGAALEGSKDFAKHFMQRHGIPTAALQKEAAARVVKEQLSVRQTEALVKALQREKKEKPKAQGPDLSLYLGELEKDLGGRLGRKVKIAHKGKKGRIELEYYNEQDLETLLNLLRRLDGGGGVPLA